MDWGFFGESDTFMNVLISVGIVSIMIAAWEGVKLLRAINANLYALRSHLVGEDDLDD